MEKKFLDKKNIKILGILVLAMSFLVGAAAIYEAGFRISSKNFGFISFGTLEIRVSLVDSSIILDKKREIQSQKKGAVKIERVPFGKHELIISSPGRWPWFKNFNLNKKNVRFEPFTVPMTPVAQKLEVSSEKFRYAEQSFKNLSLPVKKNAVISENKSISIWFDDGTNTLRAAWLGEMEKIPSWFCSKEGCRNEIVFLSISTKPRALDFFPGNDGAALVAVKDKIFAIEISAAKEKNFQPLFSGSSPAFAPRDNKSIFVKDGESIFAVVI